MRKIYLLLHKYRKLMIKYSNSHNYNKLNSSELKILANWYAQNCDDSLPSTKDSLTNRIHETKYQGDLNILAYITDIGVNKDKLIDMNVYPNK